MASRMEKYHSTEDESLKQTNSRYSKNENLYEHLYTNKVVTEFSNSNFDNVVDLTAVPNASINKRENYQRSRQLNQPEPVVLSDLDKALNQQEEIKKEKNYNINDVLENARKNRTEEDELEKKRRLKSVEYSILSDLSQEKLKEYHDSKQKKLTKDEEANLEELIHTITSNSLRKKIDDELLSDLLPSEDTEEVLSKTLYDELEDIESKTRDLKDVLAENQNEIEIDNSFYTKSMDLSNEDFELEEEDRSFIEDNKNGIISKILLTLFVLLVIGIIIYVVFRFI